MKAEITSHIIQSIFLQLHDDPGTDHMKKRKTFAASVSHERSHAVLEVRIILNRHTCSILPRLTRLHVQNGSGSRHGSGGGMALLSKRTC